uniref:Transmembrane protein n=1 Tax=Anopheles culicifacies TaxID=139723 RepID=A0A182ML73_9DIPT
MLHVYPRPKRNGGDGVLLRKERRPWNSSWKIQIMPTVTRHFYELLFLFSLSLLALVAGTAGREIRPRLDGIGRDVDSVASAVGGVTDHTVWQVVILSLIIVIIFAPNGGTIAPRYHSCSSIDGLNSHVTVPLIVSLILFLVLVLIIVVTPKHCLEFFRM